MKITKRNKNTRLSFRKKRGSQSRKLKHTQSFKRPKKMNYKQFGGANEVVLNRNIDIETVVIKDSNDTPKQTKTLENVFGTKLLKHTKLGFWNAGYVLKISIDISKFKDYVYKELNLMRNLINALLSEELGPQIELHVAEKCKYLLTYSGAKNVQQALLNGEKYDNEWLFPPKVLFDINSKPTSHCNIEIYFEPIKDGGFKITSIKYTLITEKRMLCHRIDNPRKESMGLFPVYEMEEIKDVNETVATKVTELDLQTKITEIDKPPSTSPYYVSLVVESYGIHTNKYDYYGFDKEKLDKETTNKSQEIISIIKQEEEQKKQKEEEEKKRQEQEQEAFNKLPPEEQERIKQKRLDAANRAAEAEYNSWRG